MIKIDLNKSRLAPVIGLLAYGCNNLISVVITKGSKLFCGDPVTLDKQVNGYGITVKKAASTDKIFGVIPYKTLVNRYFDSSDVFTDIALTGSIIYMKTDGAVSASDELEFTFNANNYSLVKKKTNGNSCIGIALETGGKGDLVRVLLDF